MKRGSTCISENCSFMALTLSMAALVFFFSLSHAQTNPTLVPAVLIFGDSAVDVGNNNYLHTLVRADFPPYGRDFITHSPTGRFCNGKLATDITAETLGFTTYQLPYLSPAASGRNLLNGANFASAASGYYDKTASLYNSLSLSMQLQYFKEYQLKLAAVAGAENASTLVSQALYILRAGSSDFLQNYYVNAVINKFYTPDEFSLLLVQCFTNFVQDIYDMGARRIGVTSLPPLGCLPAAITLFGQGKSDCIENINEHAQAFNSMINSSSALLQKKLPGIKIAVLDIYKPLHDLVNNPLKYGFAESRKSCCGTGTVETSLLCNTKSMGTCKNATQYVFWDSVHPSQAANQILAESIILQGITLIS